MKCFPLAVALLAALTWPSAASAQVIAFDCFALDGAQEVPSSGSSGTGMGNAWLHVPTGQLSWHITYGGLTGVPTNAHFHGPAGPGSNGGVQVVLGTANPNTGTAVLTPGQAADLQAGLWYVNVHTSTSPAGEIRGQVLDGDCVARVECFGLDGAQEVPASGSPGTGTGSAWVDLNTNRMLWNVAFGGLIGTPTNAHFHGPAAPGANGGVQVVMGPANPNLGAVNLTPGQTSDLLAGLWYVNVHTSTHPGGEIRGQAVDVGCPQWVDLGLGKPGTTGTPVLVGAGPVTANSSNELALLNGFPGSQMGLIYGFSNISAPFKHGTLVPSPDTIIQPFFLDAFGTSRVSFTWPAGVPAGFSLYLQEWIVDGGAKGGFSASNGLELITP